MRKNLICCLLLIVSFGCAPKLSTSGHYQNLVNITDWISKRNYQSVSETMPTDFWLVFDRQEYIRGLEEIGERIGTIITKDLQISNISSPIRSSGKYFQVINYRADLELGSLNVSDNVIEKLKLTYGENNVRIDSLDNRLYIKSENQMLAVYEKEQDQWKYMEANLPAVKKVFGLETAVDLTEYVR